jgi:superfamily I DNA/RNA helicase
MHDSVKLITLHSSKGLEFPLVCMPAIGGPAGEEQVLEDEARLLYVVMTRATQELVMTRHEESVLGEKKEGDGGEKV